MESNSELKIRKDRAKRMLVWIGVASIAMFFFGLTSAHVVLQADHLWVQNQLPQMFSISTVLIIVSSITMYLAKASISKGNVSGLKLWLVVTLVLGLGFTATQYLGWNQLRSEGKFLVGDLSNIKGEYGVDYTILMKGDLVLYDNGNFYKPGDISFSEPINERVNQTFNISGSFLYLFSGLHMIHLLGGLVWLIALLARAFSGRISEQKLLGLELGSIYWHFLDILWVYLFLFLLLIR